jgi:hypothetical protein
MTTLRPPAADGFVPSDMADLLTSGWSGVELDKLLHHHFPRARRGDVYSRSQSRRRFGGLT